MRWLKLSPSLSISRKLKLLIDEPGKEACLSALLIFIFSMFTMYGVRKVHAEHTSEYSGRILFLVGTTQLFYP